MDKVGVGPFALDESFVSLLDGAVEDSFFQVVDVSGGKPLSEHVFSDAVAVSLWVSDGSINAAFALILVG